MTDNNLSIWSQVEKTDPAFTKTSNQGGRQVTTIATLWPVKRATELWGPCGKGWGYEIVEERFDVGMPIFKKQDDGTNIKLCDSLVHTIILKLWYMLDGERCEVVEYGHTPFIYASKWGASQDDEAPKKSLTDALKKALSMLGFSADVYGGLFDDQNYVNAAKTEFDIQKSDHADQELKRKTDEFRDWVEKEIAAYPLIPTRAAIGNVFKGHIKKINAQCGVLGIDPQTVGAMFQRAHDAALAELSAKKGENHAT